MSNDRRRFLKATAAGMAAASVGAIRQGAAAPVKPGSSAFAMPRGLTLVNMRRDGGYALGAKVEGGVLDLTAAGLSLAIPVPADMDDLLQAGKGDQVKAVVEAIGTRPSPELLVPEDQVAFAPLVTRPEKIIMMGFNYRHHAAETGTPIPKDPPLFNKYNNALNHHGGTIKLPTAVAREFDYETELVIVFGRECRNVSEADALDYVAGYATGNDFRAAPDHAESVGVFTGGLI